VKRGLASLLCIAAIGSSLEARADGIAPGGLRGLLRVRSADGSERGALSVGAFTSYHSLDDLNATSYRLWVSQLQLGYAVSKELELGIAQPLRAWSAHGGSSRPNPTSDIGWGDLEASAKLQLPLPWRRLRLGMLGDASFPTGSSSRGMSSDATDLLLGGLLTLDLTQLQSFVPTRLHANVGYRWNRNEARGVGLAPLDSLHDGGFWPPAYPPERLGTDTGFNDPMVYRAGIEFTTSRATLFTEFAWDDFAIPGSEWRDNPVLLTPGGVVHFRNGLDLTGAVDISLQTDTPPAELPRLPEWRLTLGVTYRIGLALGDPDHDGITSKRDSCPNDAEDFDGYQDEDGCPDLDNDGDGIADRVDLAPDLAEDKDGFEDEDGRPDMDNDGDGIQDDKDQCPNAPEDYDGVDDLDGCPDETPAITPPPGASGTPPGSVHPSPNPNPAAPATPPPATPNPGNPAQPAPNSPPPPPPPKPGG
jgi:hypothetical protein